MLHDPARLIVPKVPGAGERVVLSPREAGHARARRLARGDALVLLDGSGAEGHGSVVEIDRDRVEVEIEQVFPAPKAGPEMRLGIAGLRPERLAWVVEKATELGTRRITLLRSDRTQAFRASGELFSRLTRVAQEAAKQSQSARWPVFEGPLDLADFLAREDAGSRIVLDPSGAPLPVELPADAPVTLCVGPEGGWTAKEHEEARRTGWSICSLPAGKLRAETAVIAGLALVRAAMRRNEGPVIGNR